MTIILGAGATYLLDGNSRPANTTEQTTEKISGTKIPDFEFTDINGKHHTMADFTGKIILLNFWATWCAPCVIEFPKLMTLATKHNDIIIIALSSDSNDGNIHKFLKKQTKLPDNMLVARDDKRRITTDIFSTYKLPETIIISPSQQIVKKIVGDTNWVKETPSSLLNHPAE
jgi:thiol-disulfide isomerase/thioredoxin